MGFHEYKIGVNRVSHKKFYYPLAGSNGYISPHVGFREELRAGGDDLYDEEPVSERRAVSRRGSSGLQLSLSHRLRRHRLWYQYVQSYLHQ